MTSCCQPSFKSHICGVLEKYDRPAYAYRARLLLTSALGLSFASLPANAAELLDGRLKIDAFLAQGFQSLEADDGAFEAINTDTSSGFQRLRFNLGLTFEITDNITAFADLGEEPNDFGSDDPFEISQDLGFIDFDVPGLLGRPDDDTDVIFRAGNIVATTFEFRGFSDGGAVQGNPLIGNSPADIVTAESGIQVAASHELSGLPIERVNGDVALTVPTFFEDFGPERGYNVFGRISGETDFGLDLGFGWFVGNNGGQVGERDFGDIQTTGAVFGDGENYNFPGSGAGDRDTHAGIVPGLDVTVFQINAQYQPTFAPATFRGWAGIASDDFSFIDAAGDQTVLSQGVDFVEEDSEMRFFGLEGSYDLLPDKLYGAVRYTRVVNESDGAGSDDVLDRLQLGAGFWIADNALLKGEYVMQNEGEDSPGQIGDDWDGFLAEISVSF